MKYLYGFIYLLFLFLSNSLPAQVDTTPPYIKCKDLQMVQNVFCTLTMWTNDLVDTVYDDQPANLPIEMGIRKACTGAGFPENMTNVYFTASELYGQKIELWARDAAGNTANNLCLIYILDPGNCDPTYSVNVTTPEHAGVGWFGVKSEGHNCLNETSSFTIDPISAQGTIGWFGTLTAGPGFQSTVTPWKSINPLNGVSTYDMVLIAKHILNIQPFTSSYQYIAADANQDGQITTTDLLLLKQLIQGSITELPNHKSWRFVPKDFVFPNINPFQTPFPERIDIPNTADPVPNEFFFYGVKIGDVNHSADPGL